MLEILQHWRFFRLPDSLMRQCKPSVQRKSEDGVDDGDKRCDCGPKARCFKMDISAPSAESAESMYTDELVKYMVDSRRFLPVFSLINDHLTNYMRQYCDATGRQYGKDVVVSLKGGNVFSVLATGFAKAVMHPDPIDFASRNMPLLKFGDLDFEIYTGRSFNNRFSHVVDVSKLSAMALCDVRTCLIKDETFDGLLHYSDGSNPHVTRRSDNIVLPVDERGAPPNCRSCNTLYMPVPSVLRSSAGQWYRPESVQTAGGRFTTTTNYPISYNLTLNRLFGADVILLRMKKPVEGTRASAEVFDVAIPMHRDPIHATMMKMNHRVWFVTAACPPDNRRVHICSTYYMYYSLRHTLFLEDVPAWQQFKFNKKMGRMAICMVMVSVVDEGVVLRDAVSSCEKCARLMDGTNSLNAASQGLAPPFDEFIRDVRKCFSRFGDSQDFRSVARDALYGAASHFGTCKWQTQKLSREKFEDACDLKGTVETVTQAERKARGRSRPKH